MTAQTPSETIMENSWQPSNHGGHRPVRNTRGVRGELGLEAKQVFVPLGLSAQIRSAAWRAGRTQQDWMLEAAREKLQREGTPVG